MEPGDLSVVVSFKQFISPLHHLVTQDCTRTQFVSDKPA